MRWLRELIASHYWPDPLFAALFDLNVILLVIFAALLIRLELP